MVNVPVLVRAPSSVIDPVTSPAINGISLVPVIVMRHVVYLIRTIGVILVRVLNHQFLPTITTLLTEMWIKLRTIHALRTIVSMVILCVTFQSIKKRTRSKKLGGLCVMSGAVWPGSVAVTSLGMCVGVRKPAMEIANLSVFGKETDAQLTLIATRQTTQFNSKTTPRFAWTN